MGESQSVVDPVEVSVSLVPPFVKASVGEFKHHHRDGVPALGNQYIDFSSVGNAGIAGDFDIYKKPRVENPVSVFLNAIFKTASGDGIALFYIHLSSDDGFFCSFVARQNNVGHFKHIFVENIGVLPKKGKTK